MSPAMALIFVRYAIAHDSKHGAFALSELGVRIGDLFSNLVHRVELVQLVGEAYPT